jgi:ABC-type oligopeptide transport system substrate-binding subunit
VVEYRLGLDPDISPLLLSSQAAPAGANLSGISDQTLDRLAQTVRTTVAAKSRRAAVSELESYVTSNVLMLPICFADFVFAVSDRVSGRVEAQMADPSNRYWDVLDWRLAGAG